MVDRTKEAWGPGGDGAHFSPNMTPAAGEELFTAEEALLLGRGKRDAEHKRELALKK